MLKLVAAVLAFGMPLSALAALDVSDVKKEIAGQYRLEEGGKSLLFVVRSSGAVEIPANDDFPFAGGRLTLNGSENDNNINGLPVAHVVIGVGSDEDVTDYHLLLTVESDGRDSRVRLVAQFTTFNDGPNESSDVGTTALKLSKYNRKTGKFEEVP